MKIEKDNIINLQYIEKEVMRRKFIAINTYRKNALKSFKLLHKDQEKIKNK